MQSEYYHTQAKGRLEWGTLLLSAAVADHVEPVGACGLDALFFEAGFDAAADFAADSVLRAGTSFQ